MTAIDLKFAEGDACDPPSVVSFAARYYAPPRYVNELKSTFERCYEPDFFRRGP